jgi:hypothetical protein
VPRAEICNAFSYAVFQIHVVSAMALGCFVLDRFFLLQV